MSKTALLLFLSVRYAPVTPLARPVMEGSHWPQAALPVTRPAISATVTRVSAVACVSTVQTVTSLAATQLHAISIVAFKTVSYVLPLLPAGPARRRILLIIMQLDAFFPATSTLTSLPIPPVPLATAPSQTAIPVPTPPPVSPAMIFTT